MIRLFPPSGEALFFAKHRTRTVVWLSVVVLIVAVITILQMRPNGYYVEDVTPPATRPYVEKQGSRQLSEHSCVVILEAATDISEGMRSVVRQHAVLRLKTADDQWDHAEDMRAGCSEVAHWLAVYVYHPEDGKRGIQALVIAGNLTRLILNSELAADRLLQHARGVAEAMGEEDSYRRVVKEFEAIRPALTDATQ